MIRVTIIGAGSVEFTRNVVADLCSFPELEGQVTMALHDIDPDRLAYAERAAASIVRRTGAGHRVEASAERRPAVEGADYVINEIQVGGYRHTLMDFEIPKKYGVRQTIGDTIGIGGIFRGLRTIPVAVGIGNDLHELAPDALLLNYTNPMAMVPWAVYEGTPFTNVVGVCHSVRDTHAFLARTVGVPEKDVAFRTAGFNHQCFVLRFRHRGTGEDLYPRLRQVIEADPEGLGRRVRVEIFRRFGYFPTESSEHSSEYVPWFRETYTNVRNGGLIDGLPGDACVEVPTLVDKNGVQPTRVGAIPPQCLALNRTFLNVVELTVRAALEQRRSLVYQAALVDPNTAATLTTQQIVAMCDDLIAAHGDLMPEGIRGYS